MRSPRDAMQDVEIIDVDTSADGLALGGTDTDPTTEQEQARRLARRRRLVRRWWPLPAALVVLLVGTQLVFDARERAAVAARQEVTGVLRTVDPSLRPVRELPEDIASIVLGGLVSGDLRIGASMPSFDEPRGLIAVDEAGQVAWRTSLEPPGTEGPAFGAEYPPCLGDGASVTVVRCLMLDRPDAVSEDGSWLPGPPVGARLVAVDAATGAPRTTRDVPPVSGIGGSDTLLVLASITQAALTVTAWDTAADPAGPDSADSPVLWRTSLPLDAATLTPASLTYPPSIGVERGHVVVQGELGSWALNAADGRLEATGRDYLTVSRTGYLSSPSDPAELIDADGRTVATLPGMPISLLVDDGTLPDAEFVVSVEDGVPTLSAFDVDTGLALWSTAFRQWRDGGTVLLDGALYGADREAVWAVDAATGRELWRTLAVVVDEGNGVMTDGRYLLTLAAVGDATTEDAATLDTDTGEVSSPDGVTRAVVAYALSTGEARWATPLPEGVHGVWAGQGDLLGYGGEQIVVLN